MPRIPLLPLFLSGFITFGLLYKAGPSRVPKKASAPTPIPEVGPQIPPTTTTPYTIVRGDTLGGILSAHNLPVTDILEAAKPHHDLTLVRLGRTMQFHAFAGADAPFGLSYPLDDDHTLVVENNGTGWSGRIDSVNYDVKTTLRTVEVTSSLWEAALSAGLSPGDIVTLARIFEYDFDFNTEVREGLTVEVVAEELWLDGVPKKLGQIHAARLTQASRELVGIRFEVEPGTAGFYDPSGVPRKGAFLRSPLEFSRVTSGFNKRRFHPVLKKNRAHNGTDFGAPTGTPVRAVGDGIVTVSGRNGGHGKYVKIDHPGSVDTSYSHLSSIAVKKGQRVKQGQLIGKVGKTGLATGAHLHFQVWKNGTFVDPMRVELPRAIPLPSDQQTAYRQVRDRWMAVLDAPLDDAVAIAD